MMHKSCEEEGAVLESTFKVCCTISPSKSETKDGFMCERNFKRIVALHENVNDKQINDNVPHHFLCVHKGD
jgi:hypothetical protein